MGTQAKTLARPRRCIFDFRIPDEGAGNQLEGTLTLVALKVVEKTSMPESLLLRKMRRKNYNCGIPTEHIRNIHCINLFARFKPVLL
jgi:hypothetical protein